MFSRSQILERIVRLVILDPGLPWQFLYKQSIAKHKITVQEIAQLVRKRLGGEESLPFGAGVPRRPVLPGASGNLFFSR